MANLNQVTLIGNVGKKPEYTSFDNGKQVTNFSLATTESGYTSESGKEIPDRTEWHEIVGWGQKAAFTRDYIGKGDSVLVTGMLKSRTYEDSNKIVRKVWEIQADQIQILKKATAKEQDKHEE